MFKTDKVYKGARVYANCDQVPTMKKVGDNQYVFEKHIDPDSESDVCTDPSDDEGSEDSFVVSDDESILCRPPDSHRVDQDWKDWKPTTPGARLFKDRISSIEQRIKEYADEKFVFG
jgi:hypothetical protein